MPEVKQTATSASSSTSSSEKSSGSTQSSQSKIKEHLFFEFGPETLHQAARLCTQNPTFSSGSFSGYTFSREIVLGSECIVCIVKNEKHIDKYIWPAALPVARSTLDPSFSSSFTMEKRDTWLPREWNVFHGKPWQYSLWLEKANAFVLKNNDQDQNDLMTILKSHINHELHPLLGNPDGPTQFLNQFQKVYGHLVDPYSALYDCCTLPVDQTSLLDSWKRFRLLFSIAKPLLYQLDRRQFPYCIKEIDFISWNPDIIKEDSFVNQLIPLLNNVGVLQLSCRIGQITVVINTDNSRRPKSNQKEV